MLMKFEQNRIVRNIQNFEFLGKKMANHFGGGLTPFWKTFL